MMALSAAQLVNKIKADKYIGLFFGVVRTINMALGNAYGKAQPQLNLSAVSYQPQLALSCAAMYQSIGCIQQPASSVQRQRSVAIVRSLWPVA